MTYPETIKYLESFINYERIPFWPYRESLKLRRFKDFLKNIDNPQKDLKCLHVAGSKGKGSTCIFIANILRSSGFSVGLYTSPHLSDFRERIRVLKKESRLVKTNDAFEGIIPRPELVKIVNYLRPYINKFNKTSCYGQLSFFEVYTAVAFVYFKNKKVDFVVLETGLGGRLDATNTVDPLVSVITSISYEHTQKLGNTLTEIATEKAGIIKYSAFAKQINKQPIAITAPQDSEALEVIRGKSQAAKARLVVVGRDIKYSYKKGIFNVRGISGNYKSLRINLLGPHQYKNAAVAIGAVEALKNFGYQINAASIRQGLSSSLWPGRCEIVSRRPLIVLDGAQNTSSFTALKKTIRNNFTCDRVILVLGISKDKDIRGICNELSGFAGKVILTKADNPRAAGPEQLMVYFKDIGIELTENVRSAMKRARVIAKRNDLILVCGSLFVVAEAREIILRKKGSQE